MRNKATVLPFPQPGFCNVLITTKTSIYFPYYCRWNGEFVQQHFDEDRDFPICRHVRLLSKGVLAIVRGFFMEKTYSYPPEFLDLHQELYCRQCRLVINFEFEGTQSRKLTIWTERNLGSIIDATDDRLQRNLVRSRDGFEMGSKWAIDGDCRLAWSPSNV